MYSQERELKKLRYTVHNKVQMFHHSSSSSKGKGKKDDSSSSSRSRSDTFGSLFQVMIFFDFHILLVFRAYDLFETFYSYFCL
jgi:hypothetical protein